MTKAIDRARELRKRKRLEIFEFLGNKCALCGISDQRVLQIDHIKGGGACERKTFRANHPYYSHVIEELKNGSEDYQLLCANCNIIKLIEAKEESRLIDSPHTTLSDIKPSRTKMQKKIRSMTAATGRHHHPDSIDKNGSEILRGENMERIEMSPSELAKIEKGTLRLISNRGTMEILILFCCSQKKVRFTELSKLFKHISTKTLASRLKELEKEGILKRTAYNEIPPRVEYSMTEKGQSLAMTVEPLIRWMMQWSKPEKSSIQKTTGSGDSSPVTCCESPHESSGDPRSESKQESSRTSLK
jgi:DNA-binding HxlR family transcriptional regulator